MASYQALRKGGTSGAVLIPGQPEQSILLRMIGGEKPLMPKAGGPLEAAEVELMRRWIGEGAGDDTPAGATGQWWSLKPLGRPQPSAWKSSWARTPIDAFIVARHAEKGLAASPEADRRTLIRRLTYNLHGLPPAPEEIDAFLNDRSPDAYEKLIDRLLASPRYGERWGRHWLDVAHYGETHGYDKDKPRRNAWPYRDYVIRAFNTDKPYARFVEEQIAGDVLYPEEPDGVVATGFLAAGPWDFVGHVELREGTVDKEITRLLDRDDMVASVMSSFLSVTAHCARCHDHKFDPISQEDYYSLQAVFAGVDRADRPYDADPGVHRARRPLLDERRAILADLQKPLDLAARVTSPELRRLDEQLRQLRRKKAPQPEVDSLTAERKVLVYSLLEEPARTQLSTLEARLTQADRRLAELAAPGLVYAAANVFERQGSFAPAWSPRPVHVLARGNVEAPGKPAAPGALSCVSGLAARFRLEPSDWEGARRAALARWITDPANPLTWRSIVNRVWHYHFGAGLVDTPNDFGRLGSLPTHPELLDWLATKFRDSGGSLKKLHKLILTSSVYRQSSGHHSERARLDADNRYLWRMNRSRLDAESLRDAVLYASGNLDPRRGGPSVEMFHFQDDHSPRYDYARFDVDDPNGRRRSVYRFIVRSVPDPFLESLDCPDPSISTPKRNTTLTAIQALALLNNPFMVRQGEHFARRVRAARGGLAGQIVEVYRLALGRPPSAEESSLLSAYAARHGVENLCRMVFNSNEFVFVD